MLHFEMYKDINEMLVHTYYLRTDALGSGEYICCYEGFRHHSSMLEDRIKPTLDGDLPRKYTIFGHFIQTERSYMPIFSAQNIANADLFLYQIFNGLDFGKIETMFGWFPTLYIYANEQGSMWRKLGSRRFCDKIKPLFGVKTIEELRNRIAKCKPDREMRYTGAWPGAATAILNWIKVDDIGMLP